MSGGDAARVTLRCPAKLNLCLSVGAADRGGDGRHPLVSAMLALDWGDDLTVRARPGRGLSLRRSWAADAPRPTPIDWSARRDLAWRAAEAFAAASGLAPDAELELVKRIPCGGGLGGGSADAAGVLLAMHRLWPGAVEHGALTRLAAGLGSDVSFALEALRGRPVAAVSGFGERVEPLRVGVDEAFHAVLVFPGFGCPTRWVFENLDHRLASRGEKPGSLTRAALSEAAGGGWRPIVELGNNLTGPAADARPELASILSRLGDAGLHARVTGSGSTLFVPAGGADAAQDIAARAAAVTELPTRAVRGLRLPP